MVTLIDKPPIEEVKVNDRGCSMSKNSVMNQKPGIQSHDLGSRVRLGTERGRKKSKFFP